MTTLYRPPAQQPANSQKSMQARGFDSSMFGMGQPITNNVSTAARPAANQQPPANMSAYAPGQAQSAPTQPTGTPYGTQSSWNIRDAFGNQFDNLQSAQNTQNAFIHSYNTAANQQLQGLYNQGTPTQPVDMAAAYQGAQNMMQGGWQNPFANQSVQGLTEMFNQFGLAAPPNLQDILGQYATPQAYTPPPRRPNPEYQRLVQQSLSQQAMPGMGNNYDPADSAGWQSKQAARVGLEEQQREIERTAPPPPEEPEEEVEEEALPEPPVVRGGPARRETPGTPNPISPGFPAQPPQQPRYFAHLPGTGQPPAQPQRPRDNSITDMAIKPGHPAWPRQPRSEDGLARSLPYYGIPRQPQPGTPNPGFSPGFPAQPPPRSGSYDQGRSPVDIPDSVRNSPEWRRAEIQQAINRYGINALPPAAREEAYRIGAAKRPDPTPPPRPGFPTTPPRKAPPKPAPATDWRTGGVGKMNEIYQTIRNR